VQEAEKLGTGRLWSFVLPARNERETIALTVDAIAQFCEARAESFEILIVLNGCRDGTDRSVAALLAAHHSVQVLRSETGLGRALRVGLAGASGDRVVLTGADLPFGFTDVEHWDGSRLTFGSKTHRDSSIQRTAGRSTLSLAFTAIRRAILPLPIADSQGSILVPGRIAAYLARSCHEVGYAIGPEIAYLAQCNGWPIDEVPVVFRGETRSSHVRPFRDGWDTIMSLMAIRRRSYPIDQLGNTAEPAWSR
jgi:glycosyltransferase involved in cell wall biosynthesis